jgi:L-rhamnono-1,4-lactonase
MMDKIYQQHQSKETGKGKSELKIIINHFCKANFRLSSSEIFNDHTDFVAWKSCIEKMASYPSTYMKLSGFFSELSPQTPEDPAEISVLLEQIRPWIQVVLKAFTPSRIMFGSDWPVCNVGGPGRGKAWQHWKDLVTAVLKSEGLSEAEQGRIWAGTAGEAYNIYF